jgi:hypothetical protein
MASQVSDADLIDLQAAQQTLVCPVISNETEADDNADWSRGIKTAVMIATPFWALVAFTLYRLL